jgi:hypothetical protein
MNETKIPPVKTPCGRVKGELYKRKRKQATMLLIFGGMVCSILVVLGGYYAGHGVYMIYQALSIDTTQLPGGFGSPNYGILSNNFLLNFAIWETVMGVLTFSLGAWIGFLSTAVGTLLKR